MDAAAEAGETREAATAAAAAAETAEAAAAALPTISTTSGVREGAAAMGGGDDITANDAAGTACCTGCGASDTDAGGAVVGAGAVAGGEVRRCILSTFARERRMGLFHLGPRWNLPEAGDCGLVKATSGALKEAPSGTCVPGSRGTSTPPSPPVPLGASDCVFGQLSPVHVCDVCVYETWV